MTQTQVPIISVTGTKGKTTVVDIVADILHRLDRNVVHVDTTGHFVNGERRSSYQDSRSTWSLVPSVCPGRYLWEFMADPKLRDQGVAVLETALGSSGGAGLGYLRHKVGVFLNVFEDHLGSSPRLQTVEDIAEAKSFIFSWISKTNGYAVFNADDALVCSKLGRVPAQATLVPCGITFNGFDITGHLQNGGIAITATENAVVVRRKEGDQVICSLGALPWTFNGQFRPSVWNLMHAIGALYGYFDGVLPADIGSVIEATRLDPSSGRLVVYRARNGATIIADYAHEKVSLAAVGQLAHHLVREKGKVIGVVRLAHDRTDTLLRETGHVIAEAYDRLVVYDKIDGHFRKPVTSQDRNRFPQMVGRTSQILADAIAERNPRVERIVREDEAIAHAASVAGPGDVVVVIVNDDIARSLSFITESFKAEVV